MTKQNFKVRVFKKTVTKVLLFVAWVIWTLMCIYGTYHNTVINAELGEIGDGYYEIHYNNTGDVYIYGGDVHTDVASILG